MIKNIKFPLTFIILLVFLYLPLSTAAQKIEGFRLRHYTEGGELLWTLSSQRMEREEESDRASLYQFKLTVETESQTEGLIVEGERMEFSGPERSARLQGSVKLKSNFPFTAQFDKGSWNPKEMTFTGDNLNASLLAEEKRLTLWGESFFYRLKEGKLSLKGGFRLAAEEKKERLFQLKGETLNWEREGQTTCRGNLILKREGQTVKAERINWKTGSDVLRGERVILEDERGRARANSFVYLLEEGRLELKGDVVWEFS